MGRGEGRLDLTREQRSSAKMRRARERNITWNKNIRQEKRGEESLQKEEHKVRKNRGWRVKVAISLLFLSWTVGMSRKDKD